MPRRTLIAAQLPPAITFAFNTSFSCGVHRVGLWLGVVFLQEHLYQGFGRSLQSNRSYSTSRKTLFKLCLLLLCVWSLSGAIIVEECNQKDSEIWPGHIKQLRQLVEAAGGGSRNTAAQGARGRQRRSNRLTAACCDGLAAAGRLWLLSFWSSDMLSLLQLKYDVKISLWTRTASR
eukprot:s1993_g14.t1